jgi:hypothetical protein
MSILRLGANLESVSYQCPWHGQFWMDADGQLQGDRRRESAGGPLAPMDIEPLPQNCPQCRTRLMLVRRGVSGTVLTYVCQQHGRFWIDEDGRLREERRAADRPKPSG